MLCKPNMIENGNIKVKEICNLIHYECTIQMCEKNVKKYWDSCVDFKYQYLLLYCSILIGSVEYKDSGHHILSDTAGDAGSN